MSIFAIVTVLYLIGAGWLLNACRTAPFMEGQP